MNDEIMKFNGEDREVHNELDVISSEYDILAIAEKRKHMMERLANYAVTRTNTNDWVDQQGKPYLTGSGAEKVARVFGVKIHSVKSRKEYSEDDQGRFYMYEFTCVAELPSKFDSIEAIGTCSSRDQFFAKKGGEWKPLSQVDETNIRKAAYTNCIGNAITRLLGLRNMTWEEIEKLSQGKIKRSQTSSVNYNKGSQSGAYIISEAQAKRLYAICKSSNVNHDSMKVYLKKTYGIDSSKEIKREWYDDICSIAQNSPDKMNKYMQTDDVPEVDVDREPGQEG